MYRDRIIAQEQILGNINADSKVWLVQDSLLLDA